MNYMIDNGLGQFGDSVLFFIFGVIGGVQVFLFGFLVNVYVVEQDLIVYVVFGEVMYDFIEKFMLMGGFRFIYEEKEFMSDFVLDLIINVFGVGFEDVDVSVNWIFFIGCVSVDYVFMEDFLVYVSWLWGFCFGGFNGCVMVILNVGFYDFEIVSSYEIGVCIDWFGNCLCINLILFYVSYNDK